MSQETEIILAISGLFFVWTLGFLAYCFGFYIGRHTNNNILLEGGWNDGDQTDTSNRT